jgi:hypothetical protein
MKRYATPTALVALVLIAAPTLLADLKTRERSSTKFEGMMGRIIGMMGAGGDSNSSMALKGNRMLRVDGDTGQLIDLSAETISQIDMKKKEYKVITFAEMREQIRKMREDMEKRRSQMSAEDKAQLEEAGKQLEFTADVKETGERKNIAGHDTRQVILTISGHEKGKTVDESGGFELKTDMWLAPKIAAMDELGQFMLRYAKAVYGEAFAGDMQRMAAAFAMFPAMQPMMQKLQSERAKLQGTAVMTTTTFITVRNAEQLKQAQSQQSSGGGGLGGLLAKKVMGGKPPQPRSTVFTSMTEHLSIDPSATEADVAIPAGFKEKK